MNFWQPNEQNGSTNARQKYEKSLEHVHFSLIPVDNFTWKLIRHIVQVSFFKHKKMQRERESETVGSLLILSDGIVV